MGELKGSSPPLHQLTGGLADGGRWVTHDINLPHARCHRSLTNGSDLFSCGPGVVGGYLLTRTRRAVRCGDGYFKRPTDGERGHVYPFTECVGPEQPATRSGGWPKNVRSALPGMSHQ